MESINYMMRQFFCLNKSQFETIIKSVLKRYSSVVKKTRIFL